MKQAGAGEGGREEGRGAVGPPVGRAWEEGKGEEGRGGWATSRPSAGGKERSGPARGSVGL